VPENAVKLRPIILSLAAFAVNALAQPADRPNILLVISDDIGMDVSTDLYPGMIDELLERYGPDGHNHPEVEKIDGRPASLPTLTGLASQGMRFTNVWAQPFCSPTRASILTGLFSAENRVATYLDPLSNTHTTFVSKLKGAGYSTGLFGKWHLGHLPQFLPTNNGFDTYFGIPYSNDMDRVNDAPRGRQAFWNPQVEYWNVPLLRDTEVVERPADQTTITRRYTEEAVRFIKDHAAEPFFVYLPHNLPHVPLFRGADFEGVSLRGLYGDVIEEIDWSVGEVLKTLREEGLAENTLVWFSSDNGPWLTFGTHGGSAGLLREGKGTTWEGGMREPTLAWWPGHIDAGVINAQIGSTLDIFPTCVSLAGAEVPTDRVMDGMDLSPLLLSGEPSPRDHMFYYRGTQLMAARLGSWKAHFKTRGSYGTEPQELQEHDPPLLHHLEHDPSERHNVAAEHPDVLEEIARLVEEHRANLDVPPSQLEIPLGAATP